MSFSIKPEHILFFDMDGTLVNTDVTNQLAYLEAVKTVTGVELNLLIDSRFTRTELINHLPYLSEKSLKEIVRVKENVYSKYLSKSFLLTSQTEILESFWETNSTVLVTNSNNRRALETVKFFNLSHLFSHTVCTAGNISNKYKHAISLLGIDPNLVVAFENEEAEIEKAIQVGINNINPLIYKLK